MKKILKITALSALSIILILALWIGANFIDTPESKLSKQLFNDQGFKLASTKNEEKFFS